MRLKDIITTFWKFTKIFSIVIMFNFFTTSASAEYSLDHSFGDNGKVQVNFQKDSYVKDTGTNDDGSVVVVGQLYNGSNFDWIISKYASNGELVNSFGDMGRVITDFGGNDIAVSVKILANRKILVGGFSGHNGTLFNWTLARYNSNGSLDESFGNSGYIFSNTPGVLNSILIQPDSSIIAVGYQVGIFTGQDDVMLRKYSENGSIDTSFGVNGVVLTPVGSSNDRGNAAKLQGDGKIVVVGDYFAGNDDVFLMRYNTNGSLDQTFGDSGKRLFGMQVSSGGRDVVIQTDGKIIVAGMINTNAGDTYVARVNVDGTFDPEFGLSGKKIVSFASGLDSADSIVLQNDQKIVIGGSNQESGEDTNFVIRRLLTNGDIDLGFGDAGSIVSHFSNFDDGIISLEIDTNSIVASGNVFNGTTNDWGLIKFSDNIVQEETKLNVPLLKQTDPIWANDVYDSANLWTMGGKSMSNWGCAVTSAAMVFQYNALTKMQDNSNLTPGSLNAWLKTQPDGYVRNGLLNWLALSRLSMQISQINGVNFDALEYSRINGRNDDAIRTQLVASNPQILAVPGHFVVAVGEDTENSTFFINDPFYDRESLTDGYGGNYLAAGTFTPVNSDLSYIMLVVDSDIDIQLLDPVGDAVGESFIENPIVDQAEDAPNSAGPVKVLYLQKPSSGEYELEITATSTGPYILDQYFYDGDGNVKKITVNRSLTAGNTETYLINFDKETSSNSNSTRVIQVTFDIVKQQIIDGFNQKKIKNRFTYTALLFELELARRTKTKVLARGILNAMILLIRTDKKIDPTYATDLIDNIRILRDSI